ncbi:MAG: flagellar biosynthesis protein FlgL [Proteobacteria bacterium SG_bin5]|nr:flagellar hook-associated protein FlgL [Sphingomonas sp.]OQW39548.1 MAG: flagellar biosynthesis protein FlgL [Proteobacteria bacterium SG_bin5]
MLVSTNLFYQRINGQLGDLNERAQSLQTQLSTGKRLQAPSDDPSAYRRVQRLNQAGADDKAWSANVDLAGGILDQADTTLGNVNTVFQRALELTLQGNAGTLSDGDRKVIATQLRGVLDDLFTSANARDARGQPLFGAATGDTAVTRDASGRVSFTGTGDPAAIPIADGISLRVSESAEKIFGNLPDGNGGTTDIFAAISAYADALDSGAAVPQTAAKTIDILKAAGDQISAVRGSIGARAARIELEKGRLDDVAVSRQNDLDSLEGTDVQGTILQLQKTMTILQATQASVAKLTSLNLFDYIR